MDNLLFEVCVVLIVLVLFIKKENILVDVKI